MRIWLAIKAFFATLFSRDVAKQIQQVLIAGSVGERPPAQQAPEPPPPSPRRPSRSEAVTLLAALQREARFLDFVHEPLDGYSDAQIGAAARDVHRECGKLLQRMFDIQPLTAEPEGAPMEVPAGFDAGRFHLTGNVTGEPPYRGRVTHHGWQALRCELPTWTGSPEASRVLAPIDVELA